MVKKAKVKINNWVAKHANQFNKSAVFKDRKQSQKRGYTKHKGRQIERPSFWSRVFPSTIMTIILKYICFAN